MLRHVLYFFSKITYNILVSKINCLPSDYVSIAHINNKYVYLYIRFSVQISLFCLFLDHASMIYLLPVSVNYCLSNQVPMNNLYIRMFKRFTSGIIVFMIILHALHLNVPIHYLLCNFINYLFINQLPVGFLHHGDQGLVQHLSLLNLPIH